MPSPKSCAGDRPIADSVGYDERSTVDWRASACPMSAKPAIAAMSAKSHQPSTWGWIAASTAIAVESIG